MKIDLLSNRVYAMFAMEMPDEHVNQYEFIKATLAIMGDSIMLVIIFLLNNQSYLRI